MEVVSLATTPQRITRLLRKLVTFLGVYDVIIPSLKIPNGISVRKMLLIVKICLIVTSAVLKSVGLVLSGATSVV